MSPVTVVDPRPADAVSPRSRRVPLLVLVVAVVLLLGSVMAVPWALRATSAAPPGNGAPSGAVGSGQGGLPGGWMGRGWTDGGWGGGMMGGSRGGMMGGGGAGMMSGRGVWLAGDGVPVTSISAARARATQASAASGLHPGEIIQFTGNFYVELKDSAGASVTEVLVSPATGAVSTEPGPAMMWNTGSRAMAVSSDQAKAIAARWLQANRGGETVTSIDAYPGYYTADTAAGGRPVGMLSVNASTGAVWYHTWHGTFVAEEDA